MLASASCRAFGSGVSPRCLSLRSSSSLISSRKYSATASTATSNNKMIKVGDRLPDAQFRVLRNGKPEVMSTKDIFDNKKVVLLGIPGAFTPVCSVQCPSFNLTATQYQSKGVQTVACTAVNDAFVMDAWGKSMGADRVLMLADGDAAFAKAVGLTVEPAGMGVRSKRYAMIVDNCQVKYLGVDEGQVKLSSAEEVLKHL